MGQPFVAVLLDLTIPGAWAAGRPLHTCRPSIRRYVRLCRVAMPLDPLMAHYKAYGFRGVLRKPYTVEGLEEVLQRVLEDRRD